MRLSRRRDVNSLSPNFYLKIGFYYCSFWKNLRVCYLLEKNQTLEETSTFEGDVVYQEAVPESHPGADFPWCLSCGKQAARTPLEDARHGLTFPHSLLVAPAKETKAPSATNFKAGKLFKVPANSQSFELDRDPSLHPGIARYGFSLSRVKILGDNPTPFGKDAACPLYTWGTAIAHSGVTRRVLIS